MRVSKELKRIFLGHIKAAVIQVFSVPAPFQALGCQLISHVHESVARGGFYLGVAGRKKWLESTWRIVVIGSHQVELVRGSVTHHRRKEIIRQRKLLGQSPQGA